MSIWKCPPLNGSKTLEYETTYDPARGCCFLWSFLPFTASEEKQDPGCTDTSAHKIQSVRLETIGAAFVTIYLQPKGVSRCLLPNTNDGRHASGNDMVESEWWTDEERKWRGNYDEIGGNANWHDWLGFQLGSTQPAWTIFQPKIQLISLVQKKVNRFHSAQRIFTIPKSSSVSYQAICIHLQPFLDIPDGVGLSRVQIMDF